MLRSAVAEKDPLPGVEENTAFAQVLEEVRQRRDEFDALSHVPRDMIERFGCTRVTLRQALQQLEAEGLVYRENRRGWFVSPQRIRYDPTRISGFMDFVSAQGRTPRTECLHAELRRAGLASAADVDRARMSGAIRL